MKQIQNYEHIESSLLAHFKTFAKVSIDIPKLMLLSHRKS